MVAGLLKLGFITAFLSRPVMEGFVFGLAIFVTVSQLPKLFGLEKGDGDTIRQFAHVIANLGSASVTTLAVGCRRPGRCCSGWNGTSLACRAAWSCWWPAIAISAAANLSDHGVATVGKIPSGLPSIVNEHITVSELWVLLPSALGMMLVIFSEALGAGETFADKHGYRLAVQPGDDRSRTRQHRLGIPGRAWPVGEACPRPRSTTAPALARSCRRWLPPLLSLITVVALTPLFKDLPEAVLAALIIHAVSHLMKVAEMRRFYRLVPREFWLGMLTLAGVIILDVLPGLIIGVVLLHPPGRLPQQPAASVGSRVRTPPSPGAYVDLHRHPEAEPTPGVLILRPDGTVYYVNAQSIQDTVESMVASSETPGAHRHHRS